MREERLCNKCDESIDDTGLVLREPFYAPSTEGAVDHLFSIRDSIKARIEAIASCMDGEARSALHYLMAGAHDDRDRYGMDIDKLLNVERAVKALDADFWNKVMNMTDEIPLGTARRTPISAMDGATPARIAPGRGRRDGRRPRLRGNSAIGVRRCQCASRPHAATRRLVRAAPGGIPGADRAWWRRGSPVGPAGTPAEVSGIHVARGDVEPDGVALGFGRAVLPNLLGAGLVAIGHRQDGRHDCDVGFAGIGGFNEIDHVVLLVSPRRCGWHGSSIGTMSALSTTVRRAGLRFVIGDEPQIGQHAVVALCSYHHRGMPLWGWGDEEMREVYGPSFAGSPRDFREWTYDALPNLPGKGTERWQERRKQGVL